MTAGFPLAALPAPQLRPRRRGLLSAAVDLTAELPAEIASGERWVGGFEFDPESCELAEALAIHCAPTGNTKTAGANPALRAYDPFAVVGSDFCTTLNRGRDRVGRARRQLLATRSHQIEAEL